MLLSKVTLMKVCFAAVFCHSSLYYTDYNDDLLKVCDWFDCMCVSVHFVYLFANGMIVVIQVLPCTEYTELLHPVSLREE